MTTLQKYLFEAQLYSDAAKGIFVLGNKDTLAKLTSRELYYRKSAAIMAALSYASHHRKEAGFFVEKKPDQNGYDSFVVYFELDGKQLSFHCPNREAKRLAIAKYVKASHSIEWDGKLGGSRDAAKSFR
jgi:hypothetical protein